MREFKLKSIHRTIIKTIHTLGQNVTRKQIYDHLISINHKSPHSYSKKCICDVLEKHGSEATTEMRFISIPDIIAEDNKRKDAILAKLMKDTNSDFTIVSSNEE